MSLVLTMMELGELTTSFPLEYARTNPENAFQIKIMTEIFKIRSPGKALSIFFRASRDPKRETQIRVAKGIR